jgi:hypothetical protein
MLFADADPATKRPPAMSAASTATVRLKVITPLRPFF